MSTIDHAKIPVRSGARATKKSVQEAKLAHDALVLLVDAFVTEHGGCRSKSYCDNDTRWMLPTRFGNFEVGVWGRHDGESGTVDGLDVFGRFHEPERSKGFGDSNPYSGKWNWHGTGDLTAAEVFNGWSRIVSAVLLDEQP